jgi:hypothetical protein
MVSTYPVHDGPSDISTEIVHHGPHIEHATCGASGRVRPTVSGRVRPTVRLRGYAISLRPVGDVADVAVGDSRRK